jgi:hypothetical protein
MSNAKEGVLLSRDETRLMEMVEELEAVAAKATSQYNHYMKAIDPETKDPRDMTYEDVPVWFRVLNYAALIGLVVWAGYEIFN